MPLDLRRQIAAEIVAAAQDPTISARIAATGQDMVLPVRRNSVNAQPAGRQGGGGGKDFGFAAEELNARLRGRSGATQWPHGPDRSRGGA